MHYAVLSLSLITLWHRTQTFITQKEIFTNKRRHKLWTCCSH